MTSEAKVGLLLGLIFIFVIAIVIKGLPIFHNGADGNDLTVRMVDVKDNPGIAANERKVRHHVIRPRIEKSIVKITAQSEPEPPENTIEPDIETRVASDVVQTKAEEARQTADSELTDSAFTTEKAQFMEKKQNKETKEPESLKARPSELEKATQPNIHIVSKGDTLTTIARKYYGPAQGNKLENINKIFRENRPDLRSPDEIYVGQKLVIPPLVEPRKKNEEKSFLRSAFERVKSIGTKRNSDDAGSEDYKYYVVAEGDSLWRIASEQLGDGNRYGDVAKLNQTILESEDYLEVGMVLKVPSR